MLLVACLLTQLTFCVSALYMFLALDYLLFLLLDLFVVVGFFLSFGGIVSDKLSERQVCVQSRGSCPHPQVDFCTIYWGRKKQN